MYCRNCGMESQPGDVFCRGCGTRLPEEIPAPNAGSQETFQNTEYSEYDTGISPQEPQTPKHRKRSPLPAVFITAALIGLLAGAGGAAWYLGLPSRIISVVTGGQTDTSSMADPELAGLIKVKDLEVSQKDGFYTAQATVTMPDLGQCLAEIAGDFDGDGDSYEEAGELLYGELIKYARGRKTPKVTLDVRVNLLDEARRKVSSLEFLSENPVTDEKDYEFSDSEIQALIMQEAIRQSFQNYMDSLYEDLDLDDGGIIPEYLLKAEEEPEEEPEETSQTEEETTQAKN